MRGIHRSPVNSPHIGQWRGALMFSLICARMNDSVNNREAGNLRRHRARYDVTVMSMSTNDIYIYMWQLYSRNVGTLRVMIYIAPIYHSNRNLVNVCIRILGPESGKINHLLAICFIHFPLDLVIRETYKVVDKTLNFFRTISTTSIYFSLLCTYIISLYVFFQCRWSSHTSTVGVSLVQLILELFHVTRSFISKPPLDWCGRIDEFMNDAAHPKMIVNCHWTSVIIIPQDVVTL